MLENRFHVLLLPGGECLASYCTLREAAAFMVGYQQSVEPAECRAAIVLADTRTVRSTFNRSRQLPPHTHRFDIANVA